ncbi:RNA polymerase subunit sigma-70 [Fervidobacterium thailandense]|uniref:RNA polymerase subunit sigma-70 n=1 Tax=Fervidobacterium thailandense TaxID=1008305 RepID=A0A1E3G4B7_9BACT|nr:RNA polymerase subunit sigma-70 [Fervidobacterium thailandense]
MVDKERIVKEYLPLIVKLARDLKITLPYNVELDDLIQEGVIALLQTVEKYNPKMGASFKTYAYTRIRGAMLDYLRKLDFLPKTVRQEIKKLEAAILKFHEENGKFPTFEELADALDLTVDEVKSLYSDLQVKQFLSLDSYLIDVRSGDVLEFQVSSEDDVREKVKKELLYEKLRESINKLSDREKIILSLRFEHELSLKEIAAVLGVTESRVSQLLTIVLSKLRRMLEE